MYQCNSYKSEKDQGEKQQKIGEVILCYHYTSVNSTDFFEFGPEFQKKCNVYVYVLESSRRLEMGPGPNLGG